FYRKIFLSNNFEHLCCAKRIYMHIFCDLWHVTAVRSLVKNYFDPIERSRNRIAVSDVPLDEFRAGIYPRRLSTSVSLGFEVIQYAHLPPFAHEKIDNVRADQTRGASDKCVLHFDLFSHSALAAASAVTTKSLVEASACLQFHSLNKG